jgi:hypothetical protein
MIDQKFLKRSQINDSQSETKEGNPVKSVESIKRMEMASLFRYAKIM